MSYAPRSDVILDKISGMPTESEVKDMTISTLETGLERVEVGVMGLESFKIELEAIFQGRRVVHGSALTQRVIQIEASTPRDQQGLALK